jgi:hypothetical protein
MLNNKICLQCQYEWEKSMCEHCGLVYIESVEELNLCMKWMVKMEPKYQDS